MLKKITLGVLFLILSSSSLTALPKKGYEIRIRILGLKDTTCYLANYYGEKTYLQDTAEVGPDGRFVFRGDEPLPGGIYIVAQGKARLFEFLIDQSQFFSMETQAPDFVKNMKIKGSPENTSFYEYLLFNSAKYREAEPFQNIVKQKQKSDSTEIAKKRLDQINEELERYKLDFISKHPNSFMAHFFMALKDPELPEAPLMKDGKRDSLYLMRWYKEHYWDNYKLDDERLLRTPFFHNRLVAYFDKMIPQQADSIIIEADKMIEKVRPNKEMFKYFVWYLTNWSETSNVMTYDKIFVHMVETYYSTNQAFWIIPAVQENLEKRARKLKPILIGNIAPDLIMQDTSLQLRSLLEVKARYTIIYFWDPECGHCKTESPKLKKFYDENKEKYNLEVFGVCSDTSWVKMKDYIIKNDFHWINVDGPRSLTKNYHDLYDIYSTPVIYLLDEKKTIIAKRLSVEQLQNFLERYDMEFYKDNPFK